MTQFQFHFLEFSAIYILIGWAVYIMFRINQPYFGSLYSMCIGAYFAAGLAGGIISIAVIKHDFGTQKFEHVLLDSVDLILVAVFLLVLAGLIEVFVTPLLF